MNAIARTLAMIAALCIMAGCQSAYEMRIEYAPVIVEDVRQARDLARDGDDVIAAACFDVLLGAFEKWRDYPMAAGAAAAYERARLARRFLESDHLRMACGPLLDDSTSSVLGLVRRFGVP